LRPIQYLKLKRPSKVDQLEEIIETTKGELERYIRHIVMKFGGFKITVEDAPTRADDQITGAPFGPGDTVRITIRPRLGAK
jgi:hypothetical protein